MKLVCLTYILQTQSQKSSFCLKSEVLNPHVKPINQSLLVSADRCPGHLSRLNRVWLQPLPLLRGELRGVGAQPGSLPTILA